MGIFDIDANELLAVRVARSIGNGTNKNLLFVVGGGLGDRVCAEPTLRYAIENFKDCRISVMCETPQIFSHLQFSEIYTAVDQIQLDRHLVLHTYAQGNLANQFFNANLMHPVDFASISALRMTLPLSYKRIVVPTKRISNLDAVGYNRAVVIHPGKTWPSRTFPSDWWMGIIRELVEKDRVPVIVGSETVDLFGDISACIDYRKQLSIPEFAYFCQCFPLITNDSSPVHLAGPWTNRLALVSTVRDPTLLMHWRGISHEFGINTRDFSVGKPWEIFRSPPNDLESRKIDEFPNPHKIEDFLPDPKEVVEWITKN